MPEPAAAEHRDLLWEENNLTEILRDVKKRLPDSDFKEFRAKLTERFGKLHDEIKALEDRQGKFEARMLGAANDADAGPEISEKLAYRLALMPKAQRTAFEAEFKSPNYKNFRSLIAGTRADALDLSDFQRKSLFEGANGNYVLTPPDTARRLVEAFEVQSVMMELGTVEPIDVESYFLTDLTDPTIWQGKRELKTKAQIEALQSDQAPSQRQVHVEDTNIDIPIGHDMLMDTDFDLTGWVMRKARRGTTLHTDNLVFNGQGHANEEPEGLRSFVGPAADPDLVIRVPSINPAALEWNDSIRLQGAVDEYYATNGAFTCHKDTMVRLRELEGPNGHIWVNRSEPGRPQYLHNSPIRAVPYHPQIPLPGGATDYPLWFGLWSEGLLISVRIAWRVGVDRSHQGGKDILCVTLRWTSTIPESEPGPLAATEVAGS